MKHKPWFKVWQDRVLSDPKFHSLSLKEAGALFCFWLETARNSGGIPPGNRRFIDGILLRFQGNLPTILNGLSNSGWISWKVVDGIYSISVNGWEESQSPSEESKRVMRYRNSYVDVTPPDTDKEADTYKEPPIVPRGGTLFSLEFLDFYKAFPRHIGKKAAWGAWQRAKVSSGLNGEFARIAIAAVNRQIQSRSWVDGYIPHPTTWLNQGRWEDETEVSPEAKVKEAIAGPLPWEEAKTLPFEEKKQA